MLYKFSSGHYYYSVILFVAGKIGMVRDFRG